MDVAAEVRACLHKLDAHFRVGAMFQEAGEAFYPSIPPMSDPIEVALKAAEQTLEAQLRPILFPKLYHRRDAVTVPVPRYVQPP